MDFIAFLTYDKCVLRVVRMCELMIMSSIVINLQCCIKEEYKHYIIGWHDSRTKYVLLS